MRDLARKQWQKIAAVVLAIVMFIGVIPANSLLSLAQTEDHPDAFTVTVKDIEGNAINGVNLSIQAGDPLMEVATATTSDNKGCKIESITDGSLQQVYGLEYVITCSKAGFVTESKEVVVSSTDTSNVDITMYESVSIVGIVKVNEELQENATVKYLAETGISETTNTDAAGKFSFTDVKKGNNAKLNITSADASVEPKEFEIQFGDEATVDCGEFELTTYAVTFSAKNGQFQSAEGKAISKLEVPYNGSAIFKFVADAGFSAKVFDGNNELTASNGVYTIANVKEAHSVTVQTTDVQAPVINAEVQKADEWATSKNITYTVSDNATGKVKFYVSRTDYGNLEALNSAGLSESDVTQTVTENGIYYAYAVDEANNFAKKTVEVQKIDRVAPGLEMEYSTKTNTGFVKVLNKITFGLLFKEKITVDVKATENESGIKKYQYQAVATGEEISDNWKDFESTETNVSIEIPMNNVVDFEGKIYVRAFDNAGNISTYVTNAEGTTILVDNYSNGILTVSPFCADKEWTSGKWTKEDVELSFSIEEKDMPKGGIERYEYSIDNGKTWEPVLDGENVNDKVPNKLVIDKDTNAVYCFRAVYNNGKTSTTVGDIEVKIQKTIPSNATVVVPEAKGNNEWHITVPTIQIERPVVGEKAAPVTVYYQLLDKGEVKVFPENNQLPIEQDGVYKLRVWTEDAAGNKCDDANIFEREVKVDLNNPTGLVLKIAEDNITSTGTIDFSQWYYNEEQTIKLSADGGVSGIDRIEYKKVDSVSAEPTTEWQTYNDSNGITITPNDRCIIYMRAYDGAGNVENANSTGVIVDDKEPIGDVNAAEVDINLPQANKNGIYNDDVVFEVVVVDPAYKGQEKNDSGYYSGLKSVEYKIEVLDDDKVSSAMGELIGKLGILQQGTASTSGSDGLAKMLSQKIKIPAKRFNSNNVKITIVATDNAGMVQETSTIIKIDVSAPDVTVSYNNNEVDSGKYFKDVREAIVTVKERNFDKEAVVLDIIPSKEAVEISNWELVDEGSGNKDNKTWKATIIYSSDDDYEFAMSCTDLAENETKDAGVTYEKKDQLGDAQQVFTIDRTKPRITVSYDNNSARNDKYFKANRTAKVVIIEHNFPAIFDENGNITGVDSERVKFEITAKLNGADIEQPVITWEHDGDVHTATIAYAADGDYTFGIEVIDLAGNENDGVDYGKSVAAKEFTVDTKIDNNGKAIIGGVANGKAYKEVAIPTVEFTDVNLESYELHLYRTQRGERNVDITSLANLRAMVTMDTQTGKGSFDIFKKLSSGLYDQSDDGIYRLTITMTDKAGNTSDVETVNFTINRFGSVYVYSEYLSDLIKDGGQYVRNIDKDLVITEYNPDRLVQDTLHIEITRDGKPIDEVDYDVTPVINNQVSVGESGWYQYQYTLKKSNFAEDGVYKISVSSKDATGNSPENSNYEDKDILFRVDDTVPEITSIVGLEKPIVNAEEKEVKYTIFDVIGLKSIKVYVNGELIQEIKDKALSKDANNYEGSFVLKESKKAHNVKILVEDLAGNITDTSSDDFTSAYTFSPKITVSTNFFVRWYANKLLFWGSIVGFVAVLGAVVVVVVAKRKKEEE